MANKIPLVALGFIGLTLIAARFHFEAKKSRMAAIRHPRMETCCSSLPEDVASEREVTTHDRPPGNRYRRA
jgi:hypothetical protein